MQFRQLEFYIAVYENRSFHTAANLLFISQSAVSQQIHALEEEIGSSLFMRDKHSVVPTVQGEKLYPYAKSLLLLKKEALQALAPDEPDFQLHFLNKDIHDPLQSVLFDVFLAHPEIRIRILPPPQMERFALAERLTRQHLYLVQENWIADPQIHFYPLGHATYEVLLSASDPLAAKSSLCFQDLREHRIHLLDSDHHFDVFYALIEDAIHKAHHGQIIATNSRMESVARIIAEEGGSAFIVPTFMELPEDRRLIRLPFLSEASSVPIGLAYVGSLNPSMSLFLSAAQGCYEENKAGSVL